MPQWKMENAGAITYGKPSEEKIVRYQNATAKLYTSFVGEKRRLRFVDKNLHLRLPMYTQSLKYITIFLVECSAASYHNVWNFGTHTVTHSSGSVPKCDISAKHGRGTFCIGPPETVPTSLSVKEKNLCKYIY